MPDTLDGLKAALADRYAVKRELGRGGMATVYLATDLRHHRPVAIKVLKPELAAALGPDRFLREIEVTAGLHHPHILPLYDSGRIGGSTDREIASTGDASVDPTSRRSVELLYYVMPFVEGESLRDRLEREQQLPLEEAIQIAREVAEALWNGPSWPYATANTLTGLANLLNGPPQDAIGARDYFELLRIYAKSHQLKLDDGRVVPWIDENLNPTNGDWISRTRLKAWKNGTWDAGKGGEERGKDYNHSTYCDLIISGLVGLRPRPDETVEVNPLVPPAWDAFCLDRIPYHGRSLTILWDKTGQRYGKGKGLRMFAGGKEIASSANLGRLTGPLPKLSGERRSLP